jgi:hypothetical protein
LKGVIDKGLERTADLWPDVRAGFDFVHRAARVLKNEPGGGTPLEGEAVRRQYQALLDDARRVAGRAAEGGDLRQGLEHFLKVTASYEPGLFHCYDTAGLPRTNNALEQLFGSTRHHERRCTGRKAASPGLVLRGSVRIAAGLATRGQCFSGEELAPTDLQAWREVRAGLERRRQQRVSRCRFRRDPAAYLHQLEAALLKPTLPS